MIKYIKGDLFETEAKIIAHGCNCSGGFGSGIAGQIARKYPIARKKYLDLYPKVLGEIQSVDCDDKVIVNCATQQEYGYDGQKYVSYDAIESCMKSLKNKYPIEIIAMPKIGAGLGGGNWKVIETIINEVFENQEILVYYL